jgi:hypothetical protein
VPPFINPGVIGEWHDFRDGIDKIFGVVLEGFGMTGYLVIGFTGWRIKEHLF